MWSHKEAVLCVPCTLLVLKLWGFVSLLLFCTPGSVTIPRNSGAGHRWGGTSACPMCPLQFVTGWECPEQPPELDSLYKWSWTGHKRELLQSPHTGKAPEGGRIGHIKWEGGLGYLVLVSLSSLKAHLCTQGLFSQRVRYSVVLYFCSTVYALCPWGFFFPSWLFKINFRLAATLGLHWHGTVCSRNAQIQRTGEVQKA